MAAKSGKVLDEDRGLDNVAHLEAIEGKDGLDVFAHLRGLLDDPAGHEVPGGWINRDLPRGEERVAGADGLRVGADGGGSFGSRDGAFGRHGVIVRGFDCVCLIDFCLTPHLIPECVHGAPPLRGLFLSLRFRLSEWTVNDEEGACFPRAGGSGVAGSGRGASGDHEASGGSDHSRQPGHAR